MPSDRLPLPPAPRAGRPSIAHARRARAPRGTKLAALAALVTVCALLAGCGIPGEPTTRHPVTPLAVKDLAARQLGDAVVLSFTLPSDSTDQQRLPSTPAVEVYRSTLPPSGAPPAKPAARLADTVPGSTVESYQKNGHIEFPDALDPVELARAPGQQIVYRVRTRVSEKRASADSNAVTVRVFPTPEAIGDLRATVTEDAILLTWTAPQRTTGGAPLTGTTPTLTGYRVYRTDVEPSRAATASQAPSSPKPMSFVLLGPASQTGYRDTNFQLDHVYSYVVRSVLQFASDSVESADSTPQLTVSAKDIFPPAVPQGVEAVIVPETAGMPAYVELAWAISREADLAGYVVYRSEQPDTAGSRLSPEVLLAPTFRDMTVLSGQRYFYRVAAVDRDGNQSPQSAPVEAVVP